MEGLCPAASSPGHHRLAPAQQPGQRGLAQPVLGPAAALPHGELETRPAITAGSCSGGCSRGTWTCGRPGKSAVMM